MIGPLWKSLKELVGLECPTNLAELEESVRESLAYDSSE